MGHAILEDKLAVVEQPRSAICASCGSKMEYVGLVGVEPSSADHYGAYFQCPNGHIEAVDPNS